MSTRDKIARLALGALGFILILVLVAALVAPRWIQTGPLRAQIEKQLSQKLGSAVSFQTLDLTVLPLPHVVLDEVGLSIPGSVKGRFASVTVYPGLLALVRGRVQLSRIRLAGPDVEIRLPPRAADEATPSVGSVADLKKTVASGVAALSSALAPIAPGLVVVIDDGTVRLSGGAGPELWFTDLHGRIQLPPNELGIKLSCRSNLWDHMTLRGSLDAATLSGSGHIDLAQFRPQIASAALLPGGVPQLGDAEVNLAVDVTTDQPGVVQADVNGSIPLLTIIHGDERLTIKSGPARASVRVDAHTLHVALEELELDDPHLQLAGTFSLDDTAPRASVELTAKDVDVESVRRFAVAVARGQAVIGAIFEILRGGTVPRFTLQAQARSTADLAAADALVIKGSLAQGRVHVPGVHLDLDDVTGDVSISGGVLRGEQLAGRLGNSRASAGTLRLGLTGAPLPLHLETTVAADAAEIPPLLRSLAASDAVSRELGRLSEVGGTATGKLTLDGTTADPNPAVDVSQLAVSGRLAGMPHPLRIVGGRVSYGARAIAVNDVIVTSGRAELSRLSARVDWSAAPTFEARSGKSRIVLDELSPWLAASGWLGAKAQEPRAVGGIASLHVLRVSGPVLTPSAWRFEAAGSVQDLAIDAPEVRDLIAVRSVSVTNLRLVHEAQTTSVAGRFTAPGGLTGSVDLVRTAQELNIKGLRIRDGHSDASLAARFAARQVELAFAGSLTKATLDALTARNELVGGWVRGNFRARVLLDQPAASTAEGEIEAADVLLPERTLGRLRADRISLNVKAGQVSVDAELHADAAGPLHLSGTLKPSPKAFVVDLDLSAGHVDAGRLDPFLHRGDREDGAAGTSSAELPPVRGKLRVTAESLQYGDFTWKPFRAAVVFGGAGPTMTVSEANLCGISTPGTIAMTSQGFELRVKPAVKGQQLDAALLCLLKQDRLVTGAYGLAGDITAAGSSAEIVRSARGHVELGATAGRIYRIKTIARIFSVLSVATGLIYNAPDLANEGLPYDTIRIKGDLRDGTLVASEAVLDGPTMKMAGKGSIDLTAGTLDLTFLVAPLTAVDSVLGRIPVVKDFAGGGLVSVPVKVSGRLGDPSVTAMSPEAVGSELVGLMKKTANLPVRMIRPLLPGKKED